MGGDCFKMPRFFIDENFINGKNIVITGRDVNHIQKSLRLNEFDTITLCDGKGMDYTVRITGTNKEQINTKILKIKESQTEPPVKISLFQCISKSDKMKYSIQKSVELGVVEIIPVLAERTVVKLNSRKIIKNKVERWKRIAEEAAKQCNRGVLPEIYEPVPYNNAIGRASEKDMSVIAYEHEKTKPGKINITSKTRTVSVLIGPEGGFTYAEIKKALDYGLTSVSLGPRILRTETAGMVIISIIMYKMGDIQPF